MKIKDESGMFMKVLWFYQLLRFISRNFIEKVDMGILDNVTQVLVRHNILGFFFFEGMLKLHLVVI